ncbi:MAG: hypothetical protein AAGE59_17510 [Cyanobacteria bacterium P01_F01_bin.86]
MEIRDLGYMEDLSDKNSRVSGGQDVTFTKNLFSAATNAATFTVDASIVKTVDKDINVLQNVELTGNFANLFGDVEAIGANTLSDIEFSILTIEDELSSIAVLAESAAFGGNGGGVDPVPVP